MSFGPNRRAGNRTLGKHLVRPLGQSVKGESLEKGGGVGGVGI